MRTRKSKHVHPVGKGLGLTRLLEWRVRGEQLVAEKGKLARPMGGDGGNEGGEYGKEKKQSHDDDGRRRVCVCCWQRRRAGN